MTKDNNIEYQFLRQEILDQFNREFNTVSLSLTVTLAVIGYGVSQSYKGPSLFLAPIVVLVTTSMQLVQSHYSILRIATYIRVCIEGTLNDDPKNWETCMHALRDKEKKERMSKKFIPETSFSIISYIMVTIASGAICVCLAISRFLELYEKTGCSNSTKIRLAAIIVMSIIWILVSGMSFYKLRMKTLLRYEEEFASDLKAWVKKKAVR